ncbi:hypothetical protein EVAR_15014_1 [Eumeta japonica]|uniref:Uncharacterized protein n=1 Tax=Eumeta variegata TaxID=151549 RepID=A0A4C1X765_EUMVA|nr:hypothetical protein EVAR_15014_1 [Eumeta japonica]
MMTVLRTIKISEISEFANDLRLCRNSEDKLNVFVKYHHLRNSSRENNLREIPASSDNRKLPAYVLELLRAKNAALRRASAYPAAEYRIRARALQRRVRARIQEIRNVN